MMIGLTFALKLAPARAESTLDLAEAILGIHIQLAHAATLARADVSPASM